MNHITVNKEMYEVFSKYHQANHELMDKWYELVLFTPRWWIGIILGTVSWILWIKWHNKSYSGDLLRAGLFMALLSLVLDSIGIQLGLWMYSYEILPFIPGYLPWDLCLLPVSVMVLIEIKRDWSALKKSLIYSLLAAFIGEPLAEFIGIYEPLRWSGFYSFPLYAVLFFISITVAKSSKLNSSF